MYLFLDVHVLRRLIGSNATCRQTDVIDSFYNEEYLVPTYNQCGFNGIKGVLPSAISKLVNLQWL